MNRPISDRFIATVFMDPHKAAEAYNYLLSKGYKKEEVTVIMTDQVRDKYFKGTDMPKDDFGSKTSEGASIGGGVGITLGAIITAVSTITSSITIGPLGLVIAGPIAGAVAGAGAGGAVGGMVGALIGYGINDEQARQYEEEVKSGGVLIGVHVSAENYLELENQLENIKKL